MKALARLLPVLVIAFAGCASYRKTPVSRVGKDSATGAIESQFGDFRYTVANGEVTITGYSGDGGDVTIPAIIENLSVSSIGNRAFANQTKLVSITTPDSVTSIGDSAFVNCTSLGIVIIGGSIVSIGDRAFDRCTSLSAVLFSGPPPNLGNIVFHYTPASLHYLPEYADQWPETFAGRPTAVWQRKDP